MDSMLSNALPGGPADVHTERSRARNFSSYTWLDKLRVAKGFPVDPHLSLEDYVTRLIDQDDAAALKLSTPIVDTCSRRSPRRWHDMSRCAGVTGYVISSTAGPACTEDGAFDKKIRVSAVRADTGQTTGLRQRGTMSDIPRGKYNVIAENGVKAGTSSCSNPENDLGKQSCNSRDPDKLKPRSQCRIFADIFGMKEPEASVVKKKHKRKQAKPRLCSTPHHSLALGFDHESHGKGHAHSLQMAESRITKQVKETAVEGVSHLGLNRVSSSLATFGDDESDHGLLRDDCCKHSNPVHQFEAVPSLSLTNDARHRCQEDDSVDGAHSFADGNAVQLDIIFGKSNCQLCTAGDECHCDCTQVNDSLQETLLPASKSSAWVGRHGATPDRFMTVAQEHVICRDEAECSTASNGSYQNASSVNEVLLVSTIAEEEEALNGFSADHPAKQPESTLRFSIYKVFLHAGRKGLTTREAVSRILEKRLPGLLEGGIIPRVQVAKLVQSSPYYMELENSKFVLCSAIISDKEGRTNGNAGSTDESRKRSRRERDWQYWSKFPSTHRARKGKPKQSR